MSLRAPKGRGNLYDNYQKDCFAFARNDKNIPPRNDTVCYTQFSGLRMIPDLVHRFLASTIAFLLGIFASVAALASPITEELPGLFTTPRPVPMVTERPRELTREEATTMSASFIKEFEGLMASGAGRMQ